MSSQHYDDYLIRPEHERDFDAIYTLVRDAFAAAPISDGDEQDYVLALRAGPNYIPELALVAESTQTPDMLIGHMMLTRTRLLPQPSTAEQAGKHPYALAGAADFSPLLFLLSPLCVKKEERGRGIGASLVLEGLRRAGNLGCDAVVLVGDPAYYRRFGFRPVSDFGIVNATSGIPQQFVQICTLRQGALDGVRGSLTIV